MESKAEARNLIFYGKEYKGDVDELAKETVVRISDLDDKAIKYLDYLQQNGGRAKDACQHLKQALEGLTRDKVTNWRAYVYTILRGFDKDAYEAMKTAEGRRVKPPRTSRGDKSDEKKEKATMSFFELNANAPEFKPGQIWSTAAPPTGSIVATPVLNANAAVWVSDKKEEEPAEKTEEAKAEDAAKAEPGTTDASGEKEEEENEEKKEGEKQEEERKEEYKKEEDRKE